MRERKWPRLKTFLRGTIYFNNRLSSVDCVVRDISDGGARLVVSEAAMVPESFEIYIPQKERAHLGDVKWRRGEEMGLQFQDPAGFEQAESTSVADLVRRMKRLESEVAVLRRLVGDIKSVDAGI
jgi:PilZ domain